MKFERFFEKKIRVLFIKHRFIRYLHYLINLTEENAWATAQRGFIWGEGVCGEKIQEKILGGGGLGGRRRKVGTFN